MRRIMLATDFSERSDRALRRATILARQHSAELSIVHVVDNDRPQYIVDHDAEDAHLILAQLERSLRDQDGCICTTSVLLDDPFRGIAGAAEEVSPDLLVIGPHRRQILRDAFVGTTAERTIKAVSCPVLMVNGPPVGPWRHILLTTDLSKSAEQALNRFAAMGLGVDAGSSIVNVFDTPALRMIMPNNMAKEEENHYLNAQRESALKELRQFIKNSSFERAKPIVRREESTVAREILRTAADLPADLVVIASGSKSAIAQLILGSVAQDVLRHAAVDVLTVPLSRVDKFDPASDGGELHEAE
ncbi:universal stress protein [Pseudoxanthobacter sp. M-2]|uniref:universal stress protein n=1 Tax=Pseudoxanthobacter sp. M-2 TaxID=3078754 RepID=UPI0038FC36EE